MTFGQMWAVKNKLNQYVKITNFNFNFSVGSVVEWLAYMPTLPHYPEVSWIWNESPGLPYGSSNLPDKNNSEHFKDFAQLEAQIVSPS